MYTSGPPQLRAKNGQQSTGLSGSLIAQHVKQYLQDRQVHVVDAVPPQVGLQAAQGPAGRVQPGVRVRGPLPRRQVAPLVLVHPAELAAVVPVGPVPCQQGAAVRLCASLRESAGDGAAQP